jgi:hypothetical protein
VRHASRRSVPSLLLLAACVYLSLVGARTLHSAPLFNADQLGMAVSSEDTDTDDDAMSAPGPIHFGSSLDSGVVDLHVTPELPYRPEVAQLAASLDSARSYLAIHRLFRPPRSIQL